MEFVTGALGTLLPKLGDLLQGEYELQKNVKKNIKFLVDELDAMQVALHIVGEEPTEKHNEQVKNWARAVRELSYDMEDVIDTFLVHVQGPDPPSKRSFKRFIQKMRSMLTVGKRHEIGEEIKDIKERVVQLAARRDRYKVDTVNHVVSVDPRLDALYVEMTKLVGIEEAREEIILKLTEGDEELMLHQQIVSIVGFGGLGKTTLAKAVYDEIKLQFDCSAFVTVSRNPDMKKLLKDMLYELDKNKYGNIHNTSRDVSQLIDLVREFIRNKRYLIIIDDIWDIPNWNIIKNALPDGNTGCKIISTTRNFIVAKHIGGAFAMKPLSSDSSKVLLYRRIFGNEDPEHCLTEDLAEASNRILKKCAGVPLAIITIASLLASKERNKIEWDEVCNSIGNGMEKSLDAENMRKILSYSYYDLPFYLKTCLLYLTMFPEDFKINKDRLIWLWIAEGFIEPVSGRRLFEVGESYLNELINRSMIDRGSHWAFTMELIDCHVHDVVLDFLHSLSRKENFITLLSDMDHTSTSTRVRRMSLQNGNADHATTSGTWSMPQVRSVFVIPSATAQMPTLRSFKVLRVLDLEGCDLSDGYTLEYLGNLLHLRYLGLSNTHIHELPEVVGDLRFLQYLNVSSNYIYGLPSAVTQLKHLVCLKIGSSTRLPNGIKNLTSLEELSSLGVAAQSRDTIEELGYLTELKVLNVDSPTGEWNDKDDKLLESLCKLQKIQSLYISKTCWDRKDIRNMGGLDALHLPRCIRSLQISTPYSFSTLPGWMNNLLNLSILWIQLRGLQQEYLDILGRLPVLQSLRLQLFDHNNHRILGRFNIGSDSFPRLVYCILEGDIVGPVVFQQGAMPSLIELAYNFYVWEERENAGSYVDFDFGLGNLPLLQEVVIDTVSKEGDNKKAEEVGDALKHAAEIHPNHPRIIVQHWTRKEPDDQSLTDEDGDSD